MALFDVTPEDVARGTILQPGWYPAVVSKTEDRPAKTDGSNVTFVTLRLLEARDSDGNGVSNVNVVATFSVKAPGSIINFANALGNKIGKDGKKGVEISDRTCKDRKVSVYVKNDVYEGRTINKVADFKPLA